MYHWRKNLSQIRKNEQGAPMSGEVGEMRSERGWLELGCISEIQRKKRFSLVFHSIYTIFAAD